MVVLYKWGGVYMDDKIELYKPLNKIFEGTFTPDSQHQFISAKEQYGIHNGFIACTPKHPFIKQAIDNIVLNVKNRDYTDHFMGVCGPMLLGRSILKCINDTGSKPVSTNQMQKIYKLGKNDYGNLSFYLFHKCFTPGIAKGPWPGAPKREIILTKKYSFVYMAYNKILSVLNMKNYVVMWYQKKIYK